MPSTIAGQEGDVRTQEVLRHQVQMPVAIDVGEEDTARALPDLDGRGRTGDEERLLRLSPRTAANPGARN
jgi:hypothetical protein